jgi:hypothetical protein
MAEYFIDRGALEACADPGKHIPHEIVLLILRVAEEPGGGIIILLLDH